MGYERYWDRPIKEIEMGQYLVAFLDILGFKNLLLSRSFDLINLLFEEIADAIYYLQRKNYLWGFDKIEPQIYNFSDSIIIYCPFFQEDDKDYFQINQYIFETFQIVIRDIIASSLKLRIPIRGAVSIGELYTGVASSIVPKSVSRTTQTRHLSLHNKFGGEYDSPEDYKNKILPAFKLPLHFGSALTEAYLLESKVNSIGVFMEPSILSNKYFSAKMEMNILLKEIIKIKIDGKKLLAYNWCNRMSWETYTEVKKYIEDSTANNDRRISDKWKSLLEFTSLAPKK